MPKFKIKVTLTKTIEVDDANYDTDDNNDYPLTEQIQDEIINGLAKGEDYWKLSDGECIAEIIT